MFTHKNYQIKHQDQVQMKKLLRKMNLLTSILNALFKKKISLLLNLCIFGGCDLFIKDIGELYKERK